MGEEKQESRRKFIKRLGIGTLTLGGLSLMPSAASRLTIDSSGISRGGTSFLSSSKLNLTDPIDFNKNEAKEMVIENRTSDPSSPSEGQLWVRTDL